MPQNKKKGPPKLYYFFFVRSLRSGDSKLFRDPIILETSNFQKLYTASQQKAQYQWYQGRYETTQDFLMSLSTPGSPASGFVISREHYWVWTCLNPCDHTSWKGFVSSVDWYSRQVTALPPSSSSSSSTPPLARLPATHLPPPPPRSPPLPHLKALFSF